MGSGTTCAVIGGLTVAVLVVVFALVGTSLTKLKSDEVGLKYDTFQKDLGDKPYDEGLHTGPPGFTFVIFPSVFRTLEYEDLRCLNHDGVSVYLSIGFQYRVRSNRIYHVATQFTDNQGHNRILELTGRSAIQDSCSLFNTSQFQSQRGSFQEALTLRLVNRFNGLDCDVTDVQVNNIRRPRAYEAAIEDKESAREDIEVAHNEAPRQRTEAETVRKEAETGAGIIMDEANSWARITLTQAQAEASGIRNQFIKEAESNKRLIEANELNTEAFLAYMGVRVISSAVNDVSVGLRSPAKTSYVP